MELQNRDHENRLKPTGTTRMRIAAMGDLHVTEHHKGRWAELFREISAQADVLLLCGDLTDTGDEDEAMTLAHELKNCTIPVLGVLGNHDYEKGRQKIIRQILIENSKALILDGEAVKIGDVGFAGVKGFGGGFDRYMLSMFGESGLKDFVQHAVDEALRLDRALARFEEESETFRKVALLHYSPIRGTILGEPEPIYPFLGSSRLEEPLNRRQVVAAFHGHAHLGQIEGRTHDGIPVYNVARAVLSRSGYERGFFITEV